MRPMIGLASILALVLAGAPVSAATASPDEASLMVVVEAGGFVAHAAADALPGADGQRVLRVPVEAGADPTSVAEDLAARPGVVAVERLEPLVPHASSWLPDDPRVGEQWGVVGLGLGAVWPRGRGKGHTIAVIDTGVDATPDVPEGRILDGWDFLADAPHAGDVSAAGHGTAVAHVAAAAGGNGIATAGGCWDCDVLPVVVLDGEGHGTSWELARGIRYAVDAGADVINVSLGTPRTDSATRAAIAYAAEHDVHIVASAGNAGTTAPSYPAAEEGVISVAGVDDALRLARRSNHGDLVDLAGPWCNPVGVAGQVCGTSSAAPFVAGALTSLHSATGATADALTDALTASATPVAGIRHGALAAGAALARLTTADATSTRIAGADRYATAVEASRAGWPAGADSVVVTTGAAAPDALAAGAAGLDAPVLLTRPDRVPAVTLREIERLQPSRIYLVGGVAAVGAEVEDVLRDRAPVARVAGVDRYGTAAALAALRGPAADEAWVVPGRKPSVALAGAAEAARAGAPVLLAREDGLPVATSAALADLAVSRVVLFGTSPAVTAAADDLGLAVRHNGMDSLPAPGTEALLATSADFPDALAGSALAARLDAPLLQSGRDRLDVGAGALLGMLRPSHLRVLGGGAAVDDLTVRHAIDAANGR